MGHLKPKVETSKISIVPPQNPTRNKRRTNKRNMDEKRQKRRDGSPQTESINKKDKEVTPPPHPTHNKRTTSTSNMDEKRTKRRDGSPQNESSNKKTEEKAFSSVLVLVLSFSCWGVWWGGRGPLFPVPAYG